MEFKQYPDPKRLRSEIYLKIALRQHNEWYIKGNRPANL